MPTAPPIYLDHNATAPLRAEVAEALARALRDLPGNPSSPHTLGQAARAAVERAREEAAALLGAAPRDLVFTSGATEANNAALRGVLALRARPSHVVTTAVEHPSVEEPLAALEAEGVAVTRIGVDADGRVDPEAVAAALRDDTALVSVILAHNETGVLQDMAKIAEAAHARGVPVHADATQALGRVPVDVAALGADLVAASVHKCGGPKGAGLLVARRSLGLAPLLRGGGQERGRRGGTENVPALVGLGAACALAARELPERGRRWAALRDRLWQGIRAAVPRVRRNGSLAHVLPNTLNVEFEGAEAEVLLEALDLEGICVSTGAACSSGSIEPSAALLAMGRTRVQARASLRLSVGHGVDEAQVDRVVHLVAQLVPRVREMAP